MTNPLYTIGHSNYPIERFLDLLNQHKIETVCDVRSHPYSQYCPHYNRESLEASLKRANIRYAYLGKELGARTEDPVCYDKGKVVYDRLAETAAFQDGLLMLQKEMETRRVTLMCSEKDPLTCHRTILVCRRMREKTDVISHILETGELENHYDAERRLLDMLGIVYPDLFNTEEELIEQAYQQQGEKIAYVLPTPNDVSEKGETWP